MWRTYLIIVTAHEKCDEEQRARAEPNPVQGLRTVDGDCGILLIEGLAGIGEGIQYE